MGFDRNPMRRGTDRIQTITQAGLLVAFLIGAPSAAPYLAHAVYVSGVRAGQAQAAAWRPVPAAVLRVTRIATGWEGPASPPVLLSVRWVIPGGSSRTGQITSDENAVTGAATTVWIDQSGRLAHRPLSRATAADQAIHAEIAVPVALALLLAALSRAVSFVLDRHRIACWEADWSATEPQWTRRR